MDKTRIGSVLSLWRFPVTSMQGEQLTEVELGTEGIAGDRAYGLTTEGGISGSPSCTC